MGQDGCLIVLAPPFCNTATQGASRSVHRGMSVLIVAQAPSSGMYRGIEVLANHAKHDDCSDPEDEQSDVGRTAAAGASNASNCASEAK